MLKSSTTRIALALTSLFICVALGSNASAAGELDATFNASALGNAIATVYAVKKQADGKLLVGGFFSGSNSSSSSSLTRLNPDGTTDPSFSAQNLFNSLGIGASVWSIAIQADGKIVVGGHFFTPLGVAQPGVRRLNTDGSLDNSFTPFIVASGSSIQDLLIQSDGKIIAGGNFSGPGIPENAVRLNTDGTLDTSFASQPGFSILDMELQSDGKVVMVGTPINSPSTGTVRRVTSLGIADDNFPSSFTINGRVEAAKLKANGQILIGGSFTTINGFTLGRLALLNSDGTLDLTFNQNNSGAGGPVNSSVNDVELTPEGKLMIGGFFTNFNGTARLNVARLNSDGTLDATYSTNSLLVNPASVTDLELTDTKVVTGLLNGSFPRAIAMFAFDGTADLNFSPLLTINGRVQELAVQADGKILIGGTFPYVNGVKRNGLARLNSDGSLDTTFVPYFNTNLTAESIGAITVQPDGKILVGLLQAALIVRLNSDGSQDPTFTGPPLSDIADIALQPNGQVLVGSGSNLRRLNTNGTNDATFSTPVGSVRKIIVQADGKVLIGGAFTQVGATVRGRIARLNTDGSLDNSFNPPGGANGNVEDFDLQADGKVVIGGSFTNVNGVDRLRIARMNSDGSLDQSFNQTVDGTVRAVRLQPDNKIMIGGSMGFVQAQSKVGLARLNTDGSLDGSFTGRPNTSVYEVVLQNDGKVLIGGEFIAVNGFPAMRIARLLNATAPVRMLFDYDGDSRSDISVFRPSENKWYVVRSSDSTVYQPIFAVAGDVPTPADYDGDGKTDVAIFRPSSGDWWYLSTVDGTQRTIHWGASGDVPRPSDFDGDGKADVIVYRPSDNNWYRSGSTGAVSIINFGLAGDKPVTGDFDGDGKSDVAIYRPSSGDWWYRSSINGAQLATHFGIATDTPAPADYDGDGRTDFAVYRASTGVWYILNSSNGQATIQAFGIAEDKPVAADYDGDGKADIAVFRPSTGVWYLNRSTAGFLSMQFGVSTDIPTPNAFVP